MENDQNISNSVIVIDYGVNLDDGGSSGDQLVDAGKRKRVTSAQINKLVSFMATHSDFTKGTSKTDSNQELVWESFTAELNSMGPPVHSCKEWRTVWSQYKGNKKRKMSAIQSEPNMQSSLGSFSYDKTVERDASPDVGAFKENQQNTENVKLLQRMVQLENKIEASEAKILNSIEELKNYIDDKFSSM